MIISRIEVLSSSAIQSATGSLRLVLNRDHPADLEPIFEHAKFRGPEGLGQRHLDFATRLRL